MKVLHLPLKAKWYEMIESGEKKEEYREIKPYWVKRLCFTRLDNPSVSCPRNCQECYDNAGYDWCAYPFDRVKFSLGYTGKTMEFEVEDIRIGGGNPEWGADPRQYYFVIKLGKRI